jgi:pimeloyl-ACP methyl ester carboxylesterase
LLHSGEFGAGAELSWERVIPDLARRFRLVAPDWLGYGETDKVHDFAGGTARRIRHMTAFLAEIGVDRAAFVGNSMGGSLLAQLASADDPIWEIEAMVLISGGGFAPDNAERQTLLDYDCTAEAMRRMMETLFHDPAWALRDEYIERRLEISRKPGAWECVAAARFKSPSVPPRSEFGRPDQTAYEKIAAPTLLIAGGNDPLREPGYAEALAERIPDCRLRVYDECGHMPNLEHPEQVVADVIDFFNRLDGTDSPSPPDNRATDEMENV